MFCANIYINKNSNDQCAVKTNSNTTSENRQNMIHFNKMDYKERNQAI